MSKNTSVLLWLILSGNSVYCSLVSETSSPHVRIKREESSENLRVNQVTNQTRPLSYELRINPDLEKFVSSGEVKITVSVKSSTNNVKLHSKHLTITSCQVINEDASIPSIFKWDNDEELLVIETSQQLESGSSYILVVKFHGVINDEMRGIYRRPYAIGDKKYWLVTTQFEQTFAREVFPCFDEPRFKSSFEIYLAHLPNQKAISNMPAETKLETNSDVENRVWTKFQTTPPMSTYQVAFLVSEFHSVSDQEKEINVWSRENATVYGSYAMKEAATLLRHFEDYTRTTFTLPKLDIVVIPGTEFEVTRNWRMAYWETTILLNEGTSSELHKSDASSVLCHKISQQWFGYLVTPATWHTRWLQNGFATYFQYFAVDAIRPSWKMDQLFTVEVLQYALIAETYIPGAMTRSVGGEGEEITDDTIRDAIDHEKAASIIRMFEHLVSPNSFRTALQNYLKNGVEKHNGVVQPSNLFQEFEKSTSPDILSLPPGISISQIMKMWTENTGFPLVSITRNVTAKRIRIEITSYQTYRAFFNELPDQEWIVPLTYTTKSNPKFSDTESILWLRTNSVVELPKEVDPEEWVLFNLQQTGYYRVTYGRHDWELLIDQLHRNATEIPILNRAQLITDSMAMAADAIIDYDIAFTLILYLSKETEMIPWLSAIGPLHALYRQYEDTMDFRVLYHTLLLKIMTPAYQTFGFDVKPTDGHLERIIKPQFLNFACEIGVNGCLYKTREVYKKHEEDLSKIHPDLKLVVFCNVLRNAWENALGIFDNIWSTYLESDIPFDRRTILSALGCVPHTNIIETILLKLMDPKNHEIRIEERSYIKRAISSQPSFTTGSMSFLIQKISKINELDQYGVSSLESILESVVLRTRFHMILFEKLRSKINNLDRKKYHNLIEIAKRVEKDGVERISDVHKKSLILERIIRDVLIKTNSKNITSRSTTNILTIPYQWLCFVNFVVLFYARFLNVGT